ncbi:MAG TPA: DUF4347 domain-containing protein, partial [Burkholderiales bacterium]
MAKKTKPTPPAKPAQKPKASAALKRRTRMIALEPRMLFDGALGVDLGAKATAMLRGDVNLDSGAGEPAPTPAAPEPQRSEADKAKSAEKTLEKAAEKAIEALEGRPGAEPKELVFVDTSVKGYQELLKDVNPKATVVLLDPARDGIKQITEYLSKESGITAVHIVSHGSAGELQIGTTRLNAENMSGEYAQALAEMGRHLSDDADILVYGCDFGQGEDGKGAAQTLAYLTGADVAASDDLTGHVELGADWDLEVAFGQIDTSVAFGARAQELFRYALATLDWDQEDWTAGALTDTYVTTEGEITITLSGNTNRLQAGMPDDNATLTDGNTGQEALQVHANAFASTAEFIDITIDFNKPGGVSNVSFSIFDLDLNPGGFIDKLTVSGTTTSGALNPTISRAAGVTAAQATWSATGNVITGTAAANNTGANAQYGTAVLNFTGNGITQIVIRYQNNNIQQQAIGISDITIADAPRVDLDSTTADAAAADDFGAAAYNNSTGTIPWTTDWVEVDAAGAGAGAGDVRVVGGQLRLQ